MQMSKLRRDLADSVRPDGIQKSGGGEMRVKITCDVKWLDENCQWVNSYQDLLLESTIRGDVPARPAGAAAAALVEGMVARAAAERAQSEQQG